MMVEKVPDSTYEMVGGLDKQIKEIKEVCCKEHWTMLRPFSVIFQVSHTPIFGSPIVPWLSFSYIYVGITVLIFVSGWLGMASSIFIIQFKYMLHTYCTQVSDIILQLSALIKNSWSPLIQHRITAMPWCNALPTYPWKCLYTVTMLWFYENGKELAM